MLTDIIVLFVTCSSKNEARELGKHMVENRLAACVNILGDVESVYWWNDKLEESAEVLLMFKTKAELLDDFVAEMKRIHSYDVPEIVALDVVGGNESYMQWVKKEVVGKKKI